MTLTAESNTMTNALGYLRVSTDEQADSGLGLEAQRAAIKTAAAARGLTVSRWYADEGISGSTIDKRPGLLAALDALKRDDVLLVAKRDRLARGDAFLSAWIEKEVTVRRAQVVSAAGEGNGDGPTDILMRRIVDAFAEYELRMIRARTKAALAAKRLRGERTSRHAPYGFSHDGDKLVADAHEQDGIVLARRLRARGATLREIGASMFSDGYLSRAGTRLSPQTVSNLLNTRHDTQMMQANGEACSTEKTRLSPEGTEHNE